MIFQPCKYCGSFVLASGDPISSMGEDNTFTILDSDSDDKKETVQRGVLVHIARHEGGNYMMDGMQPSSDQHHWQHYVTTHTVFPGVVRKASCVGHLICGNESCSTIFDCIPEVEGKIYTRCVIHFGVHHHPLGAPDISKNVDDVKKSVLQKVRQNAFVGGPRHLQQCVIKDIIMGSLLSKECEDGNSMGNEELQEIFRAIEPLTNKRRIGRWMQQEHLQRLGSDDLSSIVN
ncbi:hypothetical protein O6H91_Y124300 [Diphasiastrum complanatum]|nr:hypothetical protein O6H91_Y124300 [Diphasiastrum complanatum]